jgi:glycerophosphoryl diester phosphodiesterase
MGVDGIETDVRLDAAGTPILHHDRVAKNGTLISSLSQSELSSVAGYSVPTLRAALSRFPNILWNLEIKAPEALDATLAVLKQTRLTQRVLITSFVHPAVLQACQEHDVDGGILVAHRPISNSLLSDWMPADAKVRTIVWWWEICDESLLRESSRLGIRNFVYGAGIEEDLPALRAWPVHGVITDHPERFCGSA